MFNMGFSLQDALKKIQEMEHESIALRSEVDSKAEEIAMLRLQQRQAKAEIDELKLELENNAGELFNTLNLISSTGYMREDS